MTNRTLQRVLLAFLVTLLAAGSAFAAKGKVTKKAGLSGSFGWEVKADGKDDPAYVQSNLPSKEQAARISWLSKGKRLGFAAGTPTGTRVVIARAVTGTKITKLKKARWEVSLDKTDGSDAPALTLRVYEQGAVTTDFHLGSANSEAWIEVTWRAARTANSNDGEMTALRNGEVMAAVTNLDNKAKLGAFAIGMLNNADQIQKNRSIFFDRVWITHLGDADDDSDLDDGTGLDLPGQWAATEIEGAIDANGDPLTITRDVSTWTFNPDGTYSWFLQALPFFDLDGMGTYRLDGNRLTVTGILADTLFSETSGMTDVIPLTVGNGTFRFQDEDGAHWTYAKIN